MWEERNVYGSFLQRFDLTGRSMLAQYLFSCMHRVSGNRRDCVILFVFFFFNAFNNSFAISLIITESSASSTTSSLGIDLPLGIHFPSGFPRLVT